MQFATADEITKAVNDDRIKQAFAPEGITIDLCNFYESGLNIAFKVNGGIGAFTYVGEGIYEGHYIFTDIHGKELLKQAKAMIERMFTLYGANVILGYTPRDNRAARFMSRSLGFKATGFSKIDYLGRDCIEYRLEAQQWAQ